MAWPRLVVGVVVAVCVLFVIMVGWISDDAYITARYSYNLLHGYGPVFNPGERVQGYTHPLWFGLFTAGLAILREPLLVSVTLGTLLTVLTFVVVIRAIFRVSPSQASGAALVCIFGGTLLLSESWRSFQTSGLENSLTHFLLAVLVVEIAEHDEVRIGRASLLCSCLILTRPDLAVLVGPLGIYVSVLAIRRREVVPLLIGALPLVLWLAFAHAYYGTPVPNTATAKLGVYTLQDGLDRGTVYVIDWIVHEPLSAFAAVSFAVVSLRFLRGAPRACLLLGIALYVLGVALAGGDFMRGRMLLPAFFSLTLMGTLALSHLLSSRQPTRLRFRAYAAVACGALLIVLAPVQGTRIAPSGIANERLYYANQSLLHYLRNGEVEPPSTLIDEETIAALRWYPARCGPVSIHAKRLGFLAYELGPSVSVIDRVGLTDAYIAQLPDSYLLDSNPRPGHPYKRIPVSYLASRTDISLLDGWQIAVRAGDCSLVHRTRALINTESYLVGDPD